MLAAMVRLLLIAAGFFLGLHQTRVLDKRCSFCGDRAQNIMSDSGEFARGKARIDIQNSSYLCGRVRRARGRCLRVTRGLYLALAERNANHGAKIVGHDTLAACLNPAELPVSVSRNSRIRAAGILRGAECEKSFYRRAATRLLAVAPSRQPQIAFLRPLRRRSPVRRESAAT